MMSSGLVQPLLPGPQSHHLPLVRVCAEKEAGMFGVWAEPGQAATIRLGKTSVTGHPPQQFLCCQEIH